METFGLTSFTHRCVLPASYGPGLPSLWGSQGRMFTGEHIAHWGEEVGQHIMTTQCGQRCEEGKL